MAKKLVTLCFFVLGAGFSFAERSTHRSVGEMDLYQRKKVLNSVREPAILNLSEELQSLSELNQLNAKELFFNRFEMKGNDVWLYGDNLTALLSCSKKTGGTLTVSEQPWGKEKGREIPAEARQVVFKDGDLCDSAFTVFKTDSNKKSRFIVAEIQSEKVVRLDIR